MPIKILQCFNAIFSPMKRCTLFYSALFSVFRDGSLMFISNVSFHFWILFEKYEYPCSLSSCIVNFAFDNSVIKSDIETWVQFIKFAVSSFPCSQAIMYHIFLDMKGKEAFFQNSRKRVSHRIVHCVSSIWLPALIADLRPLRFVCAIAEWLKLMLVIL